MDPTSFSFEGFSGIGGIDINADLFLGLSLYDLTLLFIVFMVFVVLWKWLWREGRTTHTVTMP